MLNARIVKSLSHDPWTNLAWEEYFLQQVADNEIILYLWQNDNTVVIGRNQNAWKECRHTLLEKENGKLARRLSGGGAVFHDLGNLNFTFVMHRRHYDLDRQLKVILRAVQRLGIDAEFSGRNDLVVGGRKFSGHAYYFHKDRAFHHGTIMINTDLIKMERYLMVAPEKIASKGIDSVRSRVANLVEFRRNTTLTEVMKSVIITFNEAYGGLPVEYTLEEGDSPITHLVQKYSSWQWRYGTTPEFDITFEHFFPWGTFEMGLGLQRGHIEEVKIFSDALEEDVIKEIELGLKDCPFRKEDMIDRIMEAGVKQCNQKITGDLVRWLQNQSI